MGGGARVTYLHHWTGRDGVRSTLLSHNFYSVLANLPGASPGRVRFFDSAGRCLSSDPVLCNLASGHLAITAPPDGEGSVALDLPVPPWFPKEPGRAAARFYMLYRSKAGQLAVVHCIEEAPSWRQWLHRWPHRHRPWESKRTIDGQGLRRIRVVGINHAPWAAHQHWVVKGVRSGYYENVQGRVPSRGLLTLDFYPKEIEDDWVVKSGCLSTKNGKPYVWSFYKDAPPSVHHG